MFDGSHFERMIDEFTSSGWHRIGMNFQFFPVPGGLFSMVCLRDDEQVLGKIRMLEYHAVQGSGVRYMAYEGLHPFYDEPVSLLATGIPEDDITQLLGYQPLGENNTFTNP